MRESLRREIDSSYEAQRAANHAEETNRLGHAAKMDPMIGELVSRRMLQFQEGAKEALSHPQDALRISEQLTKRIAAIQKEIRDRLVAAGLPEDYLQPVYACEKCHDTGFVGDLVKERCECFDRKVRERVAGQSGNGLDARETFDVYDCAVFPDTPLEEGGLETQRSYMDRIRNICESYAAQFPNNLRPNLLFVGMSGLGKTFLLNCIGNQVRANGGEVLKLTAYQLTERMRAAVFDRDPDAYASLLDVPLLMLDDLGVEPLYNNITVEHLFTLLNERALSGLHTVISTNLMTTELKQRYTERVCSRLFDKRSTSMLMFRGQDVRLRNR